MPRNYHTLAAPKVYLSLLPADRCGEDFEIEGPDHPHLVLDPTPSGSLSLALQSFDGTLPEDATRNQRIIRGLERLLHRGALLVTAVRGNWAYYPNGPNKLQWPEYPDADAPDEATVAKRAKLLQVLSEPDLLLLNEEMEKVLGLTEAESKNSDGGSSLPVKESQSPEPRN